MEQGRPIERRGLRAPAHAACCLLCLSPAAFAFDTARSEVLTAYQGEVTAAKLAAAHAGADELLAVLANLPGNGGGSAGGGLIDISDGFPPAPPAPPAITVNTLIMAGADGDLAAFGDPVVLDAARLLATASFATPRDVTIGTGGAIVDTNVHTLTLDGIVTADGILRKDGDGTLVLSGANVWNVAPYLNGGTLRVTTSSLDTALETRQGTFGNAAVTLEFDQAFDGTYAHRINDGPAVHVSIRPDVTLLKNGSGRVTLNQDTRLGFGSTTVADGTLALAGLALPGNGDLGVAAGATLDLGASTRDSITVGGLSGAGAILLGDVTLESSALSGTDTWGGVISGDGAFTLRGDGSTTRRLDFTAAQTYRGQTLVREATLALTGDGALSADSMLNLLSDGVFDLSAANGDRTVASLGGSGRVVLGSNALTFGGDGQNISFGGTVSGQGDLIKVGAGTQFLYGTSAHDGTLRILAGSVHATPAALSARIVNDSMLVIEQDDDIEPPIAAYSGDISGSGELVKIGAGALWLRGSNDYTGGTRVDDGVLLGNTASLPGDIALAADTAVGFYQVDDGVYDGDLSGAGALLVYGPGRVTLAGTNTHSGGTLFSGRVRAASAANLGPAGSPLAFVGGTLELAGDITSRHDLFVATPGGVLDTGAHDFVLRGSLAGSGRWVKRGSGRFDLAGAHPGFGGVIEVAAGRAHLDGSIAGSLVVGTDATLEARVAARSATRFTLDGSAAQATLNGGRVAVIADGPLPERARYTLIEADGGVNGRLDGVTGALPGYDLVLGYTNTSVLLGIARSDVSYAGFATNPTQARVGRALDGLRSATSADARAALAQLALVAEDEMPLALESIAGTSRAGIERSLGLGARAVTRLASQRLSLVTAPATSLAGGGGGALLGGAALALGTARAAPPAVHGAWLRGFGGTGDVDLGSAAQDLRLGGIAAGYDRALTDALTAGLLAVFSESTLQQANPGARSKVESWQLGAYARWQRADFYADAMFSYAGHDIDSHRTLVLGLDTLTASADFDGHTWSSRLEAGYSLHAAPALRVTPYLALNHATHTTDDYRERGAGAFNLVVADHDDTSLMSEFGVQFAFDFPSSGRYRAGAWAYAAWARELTGEGAASARLAGDPSDLVLPLRGRASADDAARFGGGVHFMASERLRVIIGGDGETSARQTLLSANLALRLSW